MGTLENHQPDKREVLLGNFLNFYLLMEDYVKKTSRRHSSVQASAQGDYLCEAWERAEI